MLSSLIENPQILKAIYRDVEPLWKLVYIHEFSIITGEDLNVTMTFDTDELPIIIPDKWKKNEPNTVQFTLKLISAKLNYINISNSNFKKIEINLQSYKNNKRIICLDALGEMVLDIEAEWIYIDRILGYHSTWKTSE